MTAITTPTPRKAAAAQAWLATSPGRLAALLAGLLAACTLLGVLATATATGHAGAARDVGRADQRLVSDARQIYGSLADADTTASSAYLSGGVEPPAIRQHYLTDISRANAALTDAAQAAGDDNKLAAPLKTLGDQLPAYTGVIETARTDNRLGLTLGGAYLGEASTVMRTRLLPAADELFAVEAGRLSAHQDDAGGFAYVAVLAGLAVLALLVMAQIYLSRRTRRTFNLGLLGATAAITVALIWLVSALAVQHGDIGNSRDRGSALIEPLAEAQAAGLRAHSDESLFLVTGGEDPLYDSDYASATRDRDRYLRQAKDPGSTLQAAASWRSAHAGLVTANSQGDYKKAVANATDVTANGTATQSAKLHDGIDEAIRTDQKAFDDYVKSAQDDVSGLAPGLIVLTVLAAAGCALGIGARLREYS